MNDISNRTLVMLSIIAIFFSFFGTITILNSIGISPGNFITGAAPTQAAQVNVRISALTSIVLVQGGNVSFGNGSAAGGVYLSTNGTFANPNTFNDPSTSNEADDFQIQNDGNVDVNLTVNGSKASNFITTGTTPLYNFSAINMTLQGLGPEDGCRGGSRNQSQIVFGVGSVAPSICQNFTFKDSNDTMNVSIWLFVPGDTEPSNYTDTGILFTATQVAA